VCAATYFHLAAKCALPRLEWRVALQSGRLGLHFDTMPDETDGRMVDGSLTTGP
jgi:hypothetical protein